MNDPGAPGLIQAGVPGAFTCLTPEAWSAHNSVEHIAPQSPLGGDTSYESLIYDRGLVDRLGNLTLMPVELNQLVGNKPWPFKRSIYDVLSMTVPQQRVTQLQQSLNGLAQRTREALESAHYMSFCEFLPLNTAAVLEADFLTSRGNRLAELAGSRLWPMLG